jgi:hypothetical protein
MKQAGPRRRRITVAVDRFYLWMRHRDAWRSVVADTATHEQDFSSLRGRKYCLLSTFRRTGEAVPTPVWFGLADGKVYIRTEAGVGRSSAYEVNHEYESPRAHSAAGHSAHRRRAVLASWGQMNRSTPSARSRPNMDLSGGSTEGTVSRLLYPELLYIEVAPTISVTGRST